MSSFCFKNSCRAVCEMLGYSSDTIQNAFLKHLCARMLTAHILHTCTRLPVLGRHAQTAVQAGSCPPVLQSLCFGYADVELLLVFQRCLRLVKLAQPDGPQQGRKAPDNNTEDDQHDLRRTSGQALSPLGACHAAEHATLAPA